MKRKAISEKKNYTQKAGFSSKFMTRAAGNMHSNIHCKLTHVEYIVSSVQHITFYEDGQQNEQKTIFMF